MRIEQAVFTSIRGSRLAGYQLAAHSSGVNEALATELAAWGPAHDSLWETLEGGRSVNFHPLTTGDHCLSVTTLAGAEYSGRGGGRVYTQIFVLPAAALAHFANDPFLVLRALTASGRLVVYGELPTTLSTVSLVGHSQPRDSELIQSVMEDVGIAAFDQLAGAVATSSSVGVVTNHSVDRLFQALLHTLPLESRPALSFTTSLKDSPRRPFRLFHLPHDPSLMRQSQRMNGARIVEV
jgi:hypothetical protein